MNISAFIKQINEWGQAKVPFLFMVDFEMENPLAIRLEDVDPQQIIFDINGLTNFPSVASGDTIEITSRNPISLEDYGKKFERVHQHLRLGDSYLTNLTVKTEIQISHSLRNIFHQSKAKYRLLVDDKFLVFSPEIFIQIRDGKIFSYPMKGTIDAGIADARELIVNDEKELSEHVTIVDLIRNDLSLVSTNVKVTRFRYLDELKTNHKNLLQVSSEIVGKLPVGYESKLGDILVQLLPAGSVSGAPKTKTVEIIREAEGEKRGYYTGVMGCFDGEKLDSCVMIRFIEDENGKYFYRSGGGITAQSVVEKEYQEAIDKVYVPVD
ncbi:MAG: aminodeoxychorismate synthase component I [Cyclobacteriaceae bacterium]|nr:aminodeoxychorismate synthase component I [Cyclobacteriaceae bacterium]